MKTKIDNFLSELSTETDVLNYVDIDSINFNDAFNSIYEMIDDNGGFNIEIIYYSNAIDYLSNNDPSLTKSLELASEYGYEVQNLNSEILASILASENTRNDFYELEDEINDFFANLEEEEDIYELKQYNYFYNGVPIPKNHFVESVPSNWENEVNEYGEYSYGYYRAVEK